MDPMTEIMPADDAAVMPEAMDMDALIAMASEQFMPKYPAWLYKIDKKTGQRVLKKPKRQDAGMFSHWAQSDHMEYGMLLLRFLADLQFFRQKDAGIFETFEDGDVAFFSVEPTTQIGKLCSMVSGITPRISWAFKTEKEKEAAQSAEDWSYHWFEQWQVMHRLQGNSSLRWDIMFSMGVYGRAIACIQPDSTDWDWPWRAELCDPATCFPIYGDKYGLLRMTRVFRETLGRVVDGLDADGSRRIYTKFVGKHGSKTANQNQHDDFLREVTVREVWTRWERYVEIDGVEVMRYAHELGRVPFVQWIAPGEMGMTSTPELTGIPIDAEDVRFRANAGFSGITTRQMDLARKGLSFFHGFKSVVRYEEMLYGLMMTIAQLDADPPQITESGYESAPSKVDMRPGGHTRRRPGEKTTPVQTQVRAQVFGPLMNELRSARQKAGLPDNVFGIVEGSNVTGFAENTLLAATRDRIQPYIEGMQDFMSDCVELAAYIFHGFGHAYVEDAATGEYLVPRRSANPYATSVNSAMPPVYEMQAQGMGMTQIADAVGGMAQPAIPGMPPMGGGVGMMPNEPPKEDEATVAISRETFELVGFRPKVVLESFDWNMMSTKANVSQMLTQGRIWSRWTARDKLGVEDPTQEGRWIDVETAKDHPMMIPLQLLQAMWETGNVNGFLALSSMLMGGGPGGGPGGAPGAPATPGSPPGGSVPGIQSAQGDSQPSIQAARSPRGKPAGTENQGTDVGP